MILSINSFKDSLKSDVRFLIVVAKSVDGDIVRNKDWVGIL